MPWEVTVIEGRLEGDSSAKGCRSIILLSRGMDISDRRRWIGKDRRLEEKDMEMKR